MAMRELYYAGALSEFVSGYHGDCGECAELCLLHALDPGKYPLDGAHLAEITRRDVAKGWASSNGAEPLSSIARDLDTLGVKYQNDGFSLAPTFDWRGALTTLGGARPIIFEIAQAFELHADEPGVHFHFITCLGWDAEANQGIFADGDNARVRAGRSGPAGLVTYTLAELEAAKICGMLICEEAPAPPPPPPTASRAGMRAYTVRPGDTLSGIARRLGLGDWFHSLYQPNMEALTAAARAHGHPDSQHGNLIFPGTVLDYDPR